MAIFSEEFLSYLLLVVFISFISIYSYFFMSYQYWKKRGVPFLEPSFPLGNSSTFFTKTRSVPLDVMRFYPEVKKKGWKFGGIYTIVRPVLVVVDPEYIKDILVKDFQYFIDRGFYHNEKDDPISSHLFALDEKTWKNMRIKLTPTFTSGKMKMMFSSVLEKSDFMVDAINKCVEENQDIDIKEFLAKFTTDVIGACAFGIECNSFKNPDAEFRRNGKKIRELNGILHLLQSIIVSNAPELALKLGTSIAVICMTCSECRLVNDEDTLLHCLAGAFSLLPNTPIDMLCVPTTGLPAVRKDVSDFFFAAIEEGIRFRKEHNVSRPDFLQLLIDMMEDTKDSKSPFTIKQLVAQVFLFFVAGFDTSSATMSFALYELAQAPDIQEKLRDEIISVLKNHDDKITYENLNEMKYLQQVLEETMRIYPAVPNLARKCVKDYRMRDTDIVIEKGTAVVIPIISLHRDPEFYPEPLKFDPDRFTPEMKSARNPILHIPFGEGPRNCIGLRFGLMQSKIGLVQILRNFRVRISPSTKMPLHLDPHFLLLQTIETLYLKAEKI